jgi:hypothetical protein
MSPLTDALRQATMSLAAPGLAICLVLGSCSSHAVDELAPPLSELSILEIACPGADEGISFSGVFRHGRRIFLLPESKHRPERVRLIDCSEENPKLETYLVLPKELVPNGFDGFEAAVAFGDELFVTIEAKTPQATRGYVAKALLNPHTSELEVHKVVEVPLRSRQFNRSVEALTIFKNRLYAFEEINSAPANLLPVAHEYDRELNYLRALPLPQIPYRVTDATETDAQGRFWVINYWWPGDLDLKRSSDPIALPWGIGRSHSEPSNRAGQQVERLLELRIEEDRVSLVPRAPRYLELETKARNWEAITRLSDDRFLIATDTHPRTIVAEVQGSFSDTRFQRGSEP